MKILTVLVPLVFAGLILAALIAAITCIPVMLGKEGWRWLRRCEERRRHRREWAAVLQRVMSN